MFNNIKIGIRVLIGFSLVLSLFVGVSIYSIYKMRHLVDHTTLLYKHPFAVGKAIREVETHLISMDREMKEILLSSNSLEQNKTVSNIEKNEEKVVELIQLIEERFLGNLNEIKKFRENFLQWRTFREEVIQANNSGNKEAAIARHRWVGYFVDDLEQDLSRIKKISDKEAQTFMDNFHGEDRESYLFIVVILIGAVTFSIIIVFVISNSIKRPLKLAVEISDRLALGDVSVTFGKISRDETGHLFASMKGMVENFKGLTNAAKTIADGDLSVEITPRSKKDKLGLSMQIMAQNLRKNRDDNEARNWLKEGINQLALMLSGNKSPREICLLGINFLCRYVDAGLGVIYILDDEEGNLKLISSFALTKMDGLAKQYELGEGVIGQVAEDKRPLLLNEISKKEISITTGTSQEAPFNTYTFPILFENKLLGVIELASHSRITQLKQDFFEQANIIFANALQSALQNQKIKDLLEVSEQQSYKLQATNSLLEDHQQQLLQQTGKLQMTNTQFKEKQQQLQQQTEEVRIKNEHLEKTRAQLEKTNKYKSKFLANMTHELRTPLNSVILLSEILARNKNNNLVEKDMEKIKVINSAGKELLRLINDVLDISRIEAGKVFLCNSQFTTSTLIEETRNMFAHLAQDKGLDFILEDRVQKSIFTDKDKLSQILRNFLANSFKFTKTGFVRFVISKNSNPIYPVSFSVVDSGIGIPKVKLENIFEAFTQGDGTISGEYSGTGLGLSISKGLAQLIGGKIEVQSKESAGTTMTLLLQTEISENEESIQDGKTAHTVPETEIKYYSVKPFNDERFKDVIARVPPPASNKTLNLLIVENSPASRKAIKELLADIEVTFSEAEDV